MNKKFIAASAGLMLAAFTAMPAAAVTVNDIDWNLSAYSLDMVNDNSGTNDAYGLDDTSFAIALHGENASDEYSCDAETTSTELDNDYSVVCDEVTASTVAGLEWTGSTKIFADGDLNGAVARQVVSVTNTTNSDIVIDYEYHVDTEECDSGDGTVGTQSGDDTAETIDQWLACSNDNDGLEGIAYGVNQTATDFSVFSDPAATAADFIGPDGTDDAYMWNNEGLTIGAGDTVNFVYFYRSIGAEEHGSSVAGAETDAEFNAFMAANFDDADALVADSRLFEGIEGGAVNWVAVPVEEEALAETGVDASGIALGGAFALAAGAIAMLRRRARA